MAWVKLLDSSYSFESKRLGASALLSSEGIHLTVHEMFLAKQYAEKMRICFSGAKLLALDRSNDKHTLILSVKSNCLIS